VRSVLARGPFVCAIGAWALLAGIAKATPTELFFSEYIEGSGNSKALEI
jgi:hypothetical protein